MHIRRCRRPERVGYEALPRKLTLWRVVEVSRYDILPAIPGDYIFTAMAPTTPCVRGKKKFVVIESGERDGFETQLIQVEFDGIGGCAPIPRNILNGKPFEIVGYFYDMLSTVGVEDSDTNTERLNVVA